MNIQLIGASDSGPSDGFNKNRLGGSRGGRGGGGGGGRGYVLLCLYEFYFK